MKYYLTITAILVLTGCASEIDKCVDAEMKSWHALRNADIKHNEQNKTEIEEAETYNKKVKEDLSNNGNVNKNENLKIEKDEWIPLDQLYKKVNKRTVDTTPEEVVVADKRRMCIQLLK